MITFRGKKYVVSSGSLIICTIEDLKLSSRSFIEMVCIFAVRLDLTSSKELRRVITAYTARID